MKRRVAIVGLGLAVAPHAQSLVDLEHRVEVAYAVSRAQSRLDAFRARFPWPVTTDLDAVLADPSVSAILLLTPPTTHLELVRRAAAAGKHILLEKPLEATLARAREVVETCRQAGVTLGVVFQHRFRPGAQALTRRIAEGALGPLAAASVAVRWWRPQSYYDEPGRGTLARDGGGVLLTQAIHVLDLFGALTGPIAEVSAFAGTTRLHRMETEDIVGAALRFADGSIGSLDATTAAYPGFPERIELIGEKATALLVGGGVQILYHDGGEERLGAQEATGGGADPMAFAHDAHRALIADFLDALDQGRPPLTHGDEALKVHALIDALLRSSAERRPVAVEG